MLQREVELILRTKGFENGMREIIMRIIEGQNEQKANFKDMVDAISSMSDVIMALNVVADGMKYKIDMMSQRDDDGRSTQSVAEGD